MWSPKRGRRRRRCWLREGSGNGAGLEGGTYSLTDDGVGSGGALMFGVGIGVGVFLVQGWLACWCW